MSLPVGILFSWVDGVDAFTTVRSHPESHTPETVLFDEPGVADEEYTISLLEFGVLGLTSGWLQVPRPGNVEFLWGTSPNLQQ